jgi:hypothetical protein
MARLVAIADVPEFPGATKRFLQRLLCAIFHAKVCSLPPEPSTKIFMVKNLFGQK